MPEPKAEAVEVVKATPIHRFYDRTAKIELVVEFAAMSVDSGLTCRNLAQPYGHEDNLPIHTCSQMVLFQLGIDAAGEGLSYLLHKTGHRKLERLPRLYLIYGNVRGAAYSFDHLNR